MLQTLGSFYHSNSLCKLLINFFFLPFPCLHTNYHTFKLNQYYLVIRGLSFWLRLIWPETNVNSEPGVFLCGPLPPHLDSWNESPVVSESEDQEAGISTCWNSEPPVIDSWRGCSSWWTPNKVGFRGGLFFRGIFPKQRVSLGSLGACVLGIVSWSKW